jgi:hypothetical protein
MRGGHVLIVFTLRTHEGRTFIRLIRARFIHAKEVKHYEETLPKLQTDDEAERFVAEADLTEYDLSGLRTVRFEFQPKNERLNLRVPKGLRSIPSATEPVVWTASGENKLRLVGRLKVSPFPESHSYRVVGWCRQACGQPPTRGQGGRNA